MLSPFPAPGGGSARVFADAFGRELGQPVVIQQRDGASGVVGMRALASSAPDGLTIAYTAMTPLVVQPHLVRDLGFQPEAFASICNVAENVIALVVKADSPLKSVRDLLAAGRAGSPTYGSAGSNSLPHLAMQRFQAAAGGDYTHVPHRGDGPAATETFAGRLDFAAISVAAAGPMVRSGDLRLLAVFSANRHPGFADVPTVTEQGVAMVQQSFAGLYAPPGTPQPILDRYEAACRVAAEDPAYRNIAAATGAVVTFMGSRALATMLQGERDRTGETLRRLGVQPQ
jgi:tripartite-type tricarboxylate transporter receptor subunit TctC